MFFKMGYFREIRTPVTLVNKGFQEKQKRLDRFFENRQKWPIFSKRATLF